MKGTTKYTLMLSLLALVLSPVTAKDTLNESDVSCLARNIYWEARGEPVLGQVWVAKSVLDRKEDPRWPSTICGVVYEPNQYSWTREEERPITNKAGLKLAREVALAALEGRIDVPPLNHYLRCDWMHKPSTWWWKKMNFVGQVGNHCFFNAPL